MSEIYIKMQNCSVTGINTYKRAQGIKHFFLGKGDLPSFSVPILKNITLEIREGERVGFVGRNGSGKSSILKVIAGIYPPQSGTIEVSGTVGAMIEMGLGFECEMTGRQNIRLLMVYGGMIDVYNKETENKIIEFSELGAKIDWPVKSYSSGMISRLAFATNLFNSRQILLLDEVFATGDQHFVKKSMKAMTSKFLAAPISVIVSHQRELLEQLCTRAYLIEGGEIIDEDTPQKILNTFSKLDSDYI